MRNGTTGSLLETRELNARKNFPDTDHGVPSHRLPDVTMNRGLCPSVVQLPHYSYPLDWIFKPKTTALGCHLFGGVLCADPGGEAELCRACGITK